MSQPSPLVQLYLSRIREFYRQPARIFWVYGFPTILAIVLGLAFKNRKQESIPVAVVEGPGADAVVAALETEEAKAGTAWRPGLTVRTVAPDDARQALRTGKVPLLIEPSTSGALTYRFDATRPEAVAARAAADDAIQRAKGREDKVRVGNALVSEPGSRYIDFLIPGLIGLNTMGGGLWGIGFLLVNFRMAGLLKRLVATPMPRRDFLLAILGARLTFLFPDVFVLLGLGVFAFAMPVRGSLLLLGLVEVVGALAFAGIGLLIASRAKTTETVSGLMNLVMIPMWLLSGVFFSNDRYPEAMQPLIQALPLTQLTNALRLVLLDGAGIVAVLPALAILGAWAVGTFFLALRVFRWT
jgi:ABC-type multidrug transport system permease subunit